MQATQIAPQRSRLFPARLVRLRPGTATARMILKRLAYLAFVLVAVTFLVSAMIELMPGEPAYAILGESATPEQIAALHEQLNLDQPLVQRYVSWLGNAVQGDLGESVRGGVNVWDQIEQRLSVTIELVVGAQILALLFAVGTGVYAAYRPRRLFDNVTGTMASALIAVPNFVLALFLVIAFSVNLKWFPVAGFTPLSENIGENLKSVTLPLLAVAAAPAGIYQRLLRADLSATLREDYIAMAEAKGQSTTRILLRHALRPSLFSLMTLVGVTLAQTIGGSVTVEIIFGLPGIGRLLIDSINLRDVTTIQGIVAFIGVGYVVINTLVDILYGVVDPRVRRAR